MKKFSCVLLVTFVAFCLVFFSKNGKISGETVCQVNLANIPENTVFVELFIDEKTISDNFTKCNEIAVRQNSVSPESDVITAQFDNFISYTYHHKNSSSLSNLNNCETVYKREMDGEVVNVVFWDGIDRKSIEKCDALMIVYVDEFGGILGKSDIVYINKLMEKSHLVVDGQKITVKYNNVKIWVKLLLFLLFVLIESVLFVFTLKGVEQPIKGRYRKNQSRKNQSGDGRGK